MGQNYALSYSAISENEAGDLALGDAVIVAEATGGSSVFPSPAKAVAAWVCGMNNQNIDLVELPRRCGFGLIYSACPRDGADSFLINVEAHEFGVGPLHAWSRRTS